MMEAASTSETSVNFYQTTWRNNTEDSHLDAPFIDWRNNREWRSYPFPDPGLHHPYLPTPLEF
jgi:hypothetical protein